MLGCFNPVITTLNPLGEGYVQQQQLLDIATINGQELRKHCFKSVMKMFAYCDIM